MSNSPVKIRAGALFRSLLGRVFDPRELLAAARLHAGRKANRRSFDDSQLALYSKFLSNEFLHYGYFEDSTVQPEDISLAELGRAQTRYAELLLELVQGRSMPVLDVGCGMGGLSRMLRDRGFSPVALTPDRLQAAYVE